MDDSLLIVLSWVVWLSTKEIHLAIVLDFDVLKFSKFGRSEFAQLTETAFESLKSSQMF